MPKIPDPRPYPVCAAGSPLVTLAGRGHAGDSAARAELAAVLTECLRTGRDDQISNALRSAPSNAAYRYLWAELCTAVERMGDAAGALRARLFALPLVLVVGAKTQVLVAGAVPDIAEVTHLLERCGAVGATRNFGLSNALCSPETLERLKPSEAYRWSTDWPAINTQRDITPQEITVQPGREQAHLRFLVGAGITAKDAPSFLETAANIGAWGMPLTRVLARQLARPGLDLLPMPRPPTSLLNAVHTGRFAQLEVAFNLFVGNALRRFRVSIGDPTVVLSAHRLEDGSAEIRISMSSALDDTLLEGFRWPLHPLDDLDEIATVIGELLRDCRVADVRILESVLGGSELRGGSPFICAADFDRISQSAMRH